MNLAFIKEVGFVSWLWRNVVRQFYKRILRRTHTIRLPTGNRFLLPIDSFSASEVFLAGADIDWGSEAFLARLMKGTGAFLDVGANIGYYATYFEPLASQVFAFEPDPRPRQKLLSNVARLTKIEVVPLAVGRQAGTVRFTQSGSSEISHIARHGEDGVEIPMISIDDFVAQRGITVEAIKTDVEGFDLDALEGARKVLIKQRPIVLSELQPSPEVSAFAASVDYSIMAFAREPVSRRVSFVSLDEPGAEKLAYKMLFLVPEERASEVRVTWRG